MKTQQYPCEIHERATMYKTCVNTTGCDLLKSDTCAQGQGSAFFTSVLAELNTFYLRKTSRNLKSRAMYTKFLPRIYARAQLHYIASTLCTA
uniref:Uncharacterized protein n=1 Tax=Pyxicephalus adspersus TaxID=30357 RepID=A0AAV3AQ15_PYXAD|nr:TPA: hypothetical protein GDO54_008957 [Pyxicephalus adspersus]